MLLFGTLKRQMSIHMQSGFERNCVPDLSALNASWHIYYGDLSKTNHSISLFPRPAPFAPPSLHFPFLRSPHDILNLISLNRPRPSTVCSLSRNSSLPTRKSRCRQDRHTATLTSLVRVRPPLRVNFTRNLSCFLQFQSHGIFSGIPPFEAQEVSKCLAASLQ